MSAGFLRAIAAPLPAAGVTTPSFTPEASGARIAALAAEEAAGKASHVSHGREKLALTALGLLLPVRTLADAAVACDLAFGHADVVLQSEVADAGKYVRALEDLRRVVAGVGMAVCVAAGLEASAVVEPCLF